MTTLSQRPMRLFSVEFGELYARHLCRHSQAGINVIHLIALAVIWYAVYGLLYQLVGWEWPLAIPAALYLAVLAPNVTVRVLGATALFLGGIIATVVLLPQPPFWIHLIALAAFYKIQSWSHRFYTVESDMTEFNKKYRKGALLFVVLLLYEVPIVLHYLFFAPSLVDEATPARGGEAAHAPTP